MHRGMHVPAALKCNSNSTDRTQTSVQFYRTTEGKLCGSIHSYNNTGVDTNNFPTHAVYATCPYKAIWNIDKCRVGSSNTGI